MNSQEARRVLSLHRPRIAAPEDPAVAEALECARTDPALREWLEHRSALHSTIERKFREIPVPSGLRETILNDSKIVRPAVPWRQAAGLAAAAGIALLLALTLFWTRTEPENQFGVFLSRMVRTVLREYRMDIISNDPVKVRQFLADRGVPADYHVPPAIESLELTGAGILRWQNEPVAMICFDRGDREMVFLFVVKSATVQPVPPPVPELVKVNKLLTASWTEGGRVYVLAGPEDTAWLKRLGR